MTISCDPSDLANAARCVLECVPPRMQQAIKTSLLCQVASSSQANLRITSASDVRVTDGGDSRAWEI